MSCWSAPTVRPSGTRKVMGGSNWCEANAVALVDPEVGDGDGDDRTTGLGTTLEPQAAAARLTATSKATARAIGVAILGREYTAGGSQPREAAVQWGHTVEKPPPRGENGRWGRAGPASADAPEMGEVGVVSGLRTLWRFANVVIGGRGAR